MVISVLYAGGIDECGTGIDGRRDAKRLSDLFPRCAMARRRLGVYCDTAVTPDGDRNREGDQLTDLRPEEIGFLARGGERLISLDRVGAELGDFPDPNGEMLAIGIPVQHGHMCLLLTCVLNEWSLEGQRVK